MPIGLKFRVNTEFPQSRIDKRSLRPAPTLARRRTLLQHN